jgi:hypothetical protein
MVTVVPAVPDRGVELVIFGVTAVVVRSIELR